MSAASYAPHATPQIIQATPSLEDSKILFVPVAKFLAFVSLLLSGTNTFLKTKLPFYTILREYLFSILDTVSPGVPFIATKH